VAISSARESLMPCRTRAAALYLQRSAACTCDQALNSLGGDLVHGTSLRRGTSWARLTKVS